jgi:chromosome segregation ATPase
MEGTPTDLVLRMRYDGLNNNQIIQNLQREGYQSHQIFDAMSQADLRGQTASPIQQPTSNNQSFNNTPQLTGSLSPGREEIEEIAEAIIEQRWQEFEESVKKIITWKETVENTNQSLSAEINAIKENITSLQNAMFSKVEKYDEKVEDVGANVKALEMAFSKLAPAIASSVKEMERIAKSLKNVK